MRYPAHYKTAMVAGARVASGRGAIYTHRELAARLEPLAMLGYALALAMAMAVDDHARRANAIANAIVLAGIFHDAEPLLLAPPRLSEVTIEEVVPDATVH